MLVFFSFFLSVAHVCQTFNQVCVVFRSGSDAHADPLFKELKFLKMNSIHLLQLGGQFMFSFSAGNLSPKFDSFFSVNNRIHSYDTRYTFFFRLPLCRKNIRQFSISF